MARFLSRLQPMLLTSSLSLVPLPLLQIDACGDTDADQDGWTASGGDCDDADPEVNPGAAERCDGIDNDCDGSADEDFGSTGSTDVCLHYDDDGDGFSERQGDCDDTAAGTHPGATDATGDGIDADCGGGDGPQPSVGLAGSAFTSIQDAIVASVDGETVWVGPGTYLEWGIYFKGRAITLASTHGADATIVDGNDQGHILNFALSEGPDSVLRGFTLTRGTGDFGYDGEPNGGALQIETASPTLEDLILRDNYASNGGAAYIYQSAPTFKRCRFEDNAVFGTGGAVHAYYLATPTFIGCSFSDNYAEDQAGAVMLYRSDATFRGCTFSGNTTYGKGGGAYVDASIPTFDNCLFTGNTADSGAGAFFNASNAVILHSSFLGNTADYGGGGLSTASASPSITASIFSGNSAGTYGGAMHISSSSPTLSNVVVVDNSAATGGGLDLYGSTSAPKLVSSILAFNTGYDLYSSGSSPSIRYCDFYAPSGSSANVSLDSTNLKVDPGFLGFSKDGNGGNDDLHLGKSSPVVNAGDPAVTDVDGSRADQGAYGGQKGGGWDRDGDGFPDYFWPGTYDDAPTGVDKSGYDADDLDAAVH